MELDLLLAAIAAGADLDPLAPTIAALGPKLDQDDSRELVDALVARIAANWDMQAQLSTRHAEAA